MELNIKSILFATELGTNTGYALNHALSLAKKYQAKIHIIYCFDIMKFSAQSTAELYMSQGKLKDSIENSLVEEETHIRGQLKSICHERLAELRADESLIAGIDIERKPATQAILDAAAIYQADLIVMGAQRQSGLSSARVSSTTMKVLHRATVPVFVAKGDASQA
jgi:nucleotide-binding universal stress UspA family protein